MGSPDFLEVSIFISVAIERGQARVRTGSAAAVRTDIDAARAYPARDDG
jgi:hypothetical protein